MDGFAKWAADDPLGAWRDLEPGSIVILTAIGLVLGLGIYILNLTYGGSKTDDNFEPW